MSKGPGYLHDFLKRVWRGEAIDNVEGGILPSTNIQNSIPMPQVEQLMSEGNWRVVDKTISQTAWQSMTDTYDWNINTEDLEPWMFRATVVVVLENTVTGEVKIVREDLNAY